MAEIMAICVLVFMVSPCGFSLFVLSIDRIVGIMSCDENAEMKMICICVYTLGAVDWESVYI